MFKIMISMLLLVAVAGLTLAVAGCEKDEIRVERRVTVEDQVVDQHTVVE